MDYIITNETEPNVVIVNGYPQSGKTTFENMCINILGRGHCRIYSSVDFVKEIAVRCGWDGTKTVKNRNFLSALKDLLTKWNDLPFKKCIEEIRLFKDEIESVGDIAGSGIIFIDVREPAEISRFKEIGASALLVENPRVPPPSNDLSHADTMIGPESLYDFKIVNDGNFEDLRKKAYNFIKEIAERTGGKVWNNG